MTCIKIVGKYGSPYKMNFFMFPAFDVSVGMKKYFGWWRIMDYERLASPSVFVEKEAEHLNITMWPPPEESDGEPFRKPFIILGLILLVTVLFASAILLILRYRGNFLLTKGEVDEFRHRIVEIGNASETATSHLLDMRTFPKQFEIPISRLILRNIIGKGNFGLVYKAELLASDNAGERETTPIAVKLPNPDCINESFKSLLSELKILCHIGSHPNVLQFVGAYIRVKEIGRGAIYIATELCQGGDLQEYLRNLNPERVNTMMDPPQPQPLIYELSRFAHEIAQGMKYIASKNVIHGDLSARNVLLNSDLQCKIADFGLSKKFDEQKEGHDHEALPWRWMALETLRRNVFTTNSDVWSYGVTLWEIFSLGAVPYPGVSWTDGFIEKLDGGFRLPAPTYSDSTVYEIMVKCWDANPVVRPDFTELGELFGGLWIRQRFLATHPHSQKWLTTE